jgi:subtilisin family serine protease
MTYKIRVILCFSAFLCLTGDVFGAEKEIEWNSFRKHLGLNVQDSTLAEVLGGIQRETGWQVRLQPGLNRPVSVKFKPKPLDEALQFLLGDLRYTLIARPGEPGKLEVRKGNALAKTEPMAEPVSKPKVAANQLAVIFRPGQDAAALAKRFNADLLGFIKIANVAQLKFTDPRAMAAARQAMAELGVTDIIDDVHLYPRPATPILVAGGAGILPISLRPEEVDTKGQLIIGLIDTAVQPAGLDQPGFLLPALSIAEPFTPPNHSPTHGTSMAGTILRGLANKDLGVQKSPVRILPVDVFGASANANSFNIANGITEAVNNGATIINLSLGGYQASPLLQRIIATHHNNGVLFVGAAGNEPVTTPHFPAAHPEVMAVTATRLNGELTAYANRGNFIDVAARGTHPVRFGKRTYAITGTSASSAYVSGLAAGLASAHGKKPREIRELIIENRPFVPPKPKEEKKN